MELVGARDAMQGTSPLTALTSFAKVSSLRFPPTIAGSNL